MGKKATKAADNIYCKARYDAAEINNQFDSREEAATAIGIDRTRLARIELGNIIPYPDEVYAMSVAYNTPELCNYHCAQVCPIGKGTGTIQSVDISDFDRLALRVLGSLKDIDSIRTSLISLSEDGTISESEHKDFYEILDSLDKISQNATALKLWAKKNIKTADSKE